MFVRSFIRSFVVAELENKIGKHVAAAFRASVQMLINYVHDKFPYNSLPFEDIYAKYCIFVLLHTVFLAMEKQNTDTLLKRDTFHGWHIILGRRT